VEAGGDAVADALDELDGGGELKRHGLMVAAGIVRGAGFEGRRAVAGEVRWGSLVARLGRAGEMIG
jgi:hypothetical protein